MEQKRMAIFASGSGTNAENIFKYILGNEKSMVDSLWANKSDAYALVRAQKHGVKTFVYNRNQLYNTNEMIKT